MNKIRLLLAAAAAAAVAIGPLAASAGTNTRAHEVAPRSPVSDALAEGEALAITGTISADTDLGLTDVTNATKCRAGTKTVHASTTYSDVTGTPAYTWWHNVTFSWNCTVVTSISHSSGVIIYNPLYSFDGYIANFVTGAGTTTAHAEAQGRVGMCVHVAIDGCALEHDPGIGWVVTGTGGAKAFQQGD